MAYRVQVLAYNDVGKGIKSDPVTIGKCAVLGCRAHTVGGMWQQSVCGGLNV